MQVMRERLDLDHACKLEALNKELNSKPAYPRLFWRYRDRKVVFDKARNKKVAVVVAFVHSQSHSLFFRTACKLSGLSCSFKPYRLRLINEDR